MIDGFAFNKESVVNAYETGLLGDVEETKEAYDRGESPWCEDGSLHPH